MPSYVLTFTLTDTASTGSNELAWGIYTAASAGGTELATGTATSGVEVTTSTINDAGLAHGSNTRWLYVIDGAGNVLDQSFTVTAHLSNPVPVLTDIEPDTKAATTGGFTLTVTGTDFISVSVVRWNGSDLPTTYVSPTELKATVDAALIETEGTASVTVFNPAPDGGLSDELTFTIGPPPPQTSIPVSRARMPEADLLRVSLYPPLGIYPRYRLDYDDINPRVTALHWRSGPGGWTDAGIGIAHPLARYGEAPENPRLPRELRWIPFAHVEITRGPHVVFAGRLASVERTGGLVSGFAVNGYGIAATRDNEIRSAGDDTIQTTGELLRSLLASTAPHLRVGTGEAWMDPGVAHAAEEFDLMHLADVLEQVELEGDSAGNPVDWWVYEGQVLQLRPRVEPEQPDYQVSPRHVAGWYEDTGSMIGMATYERQTDEGDTVTENTYQVNTAFLESYGFQKSIVLRLGTLSEDAARAITRTYLQRHSRPVVSASLEFGPDDPLTGPGGRVMPKVLARRGQWVQVGREAMQMVVTTDYDAASDTLRMEIGEFVPGLATQIANLQRDQLKRQRMLSSRAGRLR